jgi:hypothetical protein
MTFDPARFYKESPEKRILFRWVFDFADGKTKAGGWYAAERREDRSTAVDLTGLKTARIEGKSFLNKSVKTYAECRADDFVSFQDLAALIVSDGKGQNHVYGKRLNTKTGSIDCFEDGSIERRPNGDSSKG